ncbi:MAG: efflux RND transporter periplasmic adaptor subunit [Verrucomicrobia bacterium]|nr:efflux RND transporter periplasmic adaptor subunit [Verrucomicrobiota bacterium]
MKTFLALLVTALLAAAATWLTMRKFPPSPAPAAGSAPEPRLYQCGMHPKVSSGSPGRCTLCGMELTAAAASDKAVNAAGTGDLVALTQSQIQVLQVQSVEARIEPLGRTLRVAGVLAENASRHRLLAAYSEGRIDKLHVNGIGAEVTEGQPVAEFYSATLLKAEREYIQLTGELRKYSELRLRQLGLPPAQIEALAQKSPDALTSQLLSPCTGTVVAQAVYEGQYVSAGERLFELADFSTMWFVFRAYEQDLPWLRTGQSVRVATPALPGKTFTGKITFINSVLEDATRSTSVRVELPNPPVNGRRELLSRLSADGVVELEAPSVLSVPRSAVLETGPEAVVYIDHGDGAYERRILQTGRRGDCAHEILSGLKEGERVVTNGNLLIDGQAEMNRAFMTPPAAVAAAPAAAAPPAALSDGQQRAIGDFVKVADAMAAALAADDLAAFNTASPPATKTTESMVQQLRPAAADAMALDALDAARDFHGFADMQGARVAFHKFTVAATAVLEPLRKAGGMPEFQVYECPMVNQAIPGVPKRAHWIQTGGRDLKNPFFGKEMLNCGEEIKP